MSSSCVRIAEGMITFLDRQLTDRDEEVRS
jgi:hypothetical protein